MGVGRVEKFAQGATEYLMIFAVVLLLVAGVIYFVSKPGGYPPISATPVNVDNEIRIRVDVGSIPPGDWQYSVSTIEGVYSWTYGDEKLGEPYVTIATDQAVGTYYVSLKHKPSDYIYFSDRRIVIA